MSGLYFFVLRAKDCWGLWERADTLSLTEQVIPKISVLLGGKDMLADDEIYFCPPFKPYSCTCMCMDI